MKLGGTVRRRAVLDARRRASFASRAKRKIRRWRSTPSQDRQWPCCDPPYPI